MTAFIIIAVVVVLLLLIMSAYNKCVRLKNQGEEA